ncbi:MAG: ROK family protein [Symploca sp. SIO1A3]|nr:ROK family protein [Symploca sp. SIO1A3]
MTEKNGTIRTLTVDIGGSGVKAMILDQAGNPLTERSRVETPQPPKPDAIIEAITHLATEQGEFERVSVGFPGVVTNGVTKTAVNLDPDWIGLDLATKLSERLGKPVRVANDADIQGYGAISGKGVELVITLGTGFGSALFVEGKLVPNLEAGHHPFRKKDTYEEQLGRAALEKVGKKKWNSRVKKAIASLEHLFNYNCLYIGGGEAKKINFELPPNVKIVPNVNGLLGGIALWKE